MFPGRSNHLPAEAGQSKFAVRRRSHQEICCKYPILKDFLALHLRPRRFLIDIRQPKTPMEVEIAEALQTSKNVMTQKRELTVAEEEALKAMSLEEVGLIQRFPTFVVVFINIIILEHFQAVRRRNELRRMRSLQSYQEAKARRQNKIKSKKYHRILKKDRLKKNMKEFEELQKTDPESALKKLEVMDKSRIGVGFLFFSIFIVVMINVCF